MDTVGNINYFSAPCADQRNVEFTLSRLNLMRFLQQSEGIVCVRCRDRYRNQCRYSGWVLLTLLITLIFPPCSNGQTSSSGAVTGVSIDPTGAILPGAVVRLRRFETGAVESAISDEEGRFHFSLLQPGAYELQASKSGADNLVASATINVHVTETTHVELHLRLAVVSHTVRVLAEPTLVQTDTPALGQVVNETAVSALPLVTRNFTQIASLSPGVTAGVSNAGELGLGGSALGQIANSNDGLFVHGARSYDNNFQIDGLSVNDVQGSGEGSGGIPIPNPDILQEFKVQTALYDAQYGRYGGGNINVITRSGGDQYHGAVFEYFRNDVLNANDYFRKQIDRSRPVLKQNQFGLALGGPIEKSKLFFFSSYQGTRQLNGIAAGQSRVACAASLLEPPLTNDRSAAELGRMFGGMTGAQGGVAVDPDGSNINASALSLLNFRRPDGTFLIPTPQAVNTTKPFSQQGFSTFTDPCHFSEDQFSTNLDYFARANSRFSAHLFLSNDDETVSFPGNGLNPSGNVPGFPSPNDSQFIVLSLAHTYTISNSWLNEARVGFVRTRSDTDAETSFRWSDIGVAEGEMSRNNELPSLQIPGSISLASGFPRLFAQNSYVLSDDLSFVHRGHTARLGGSLTRLQDNVNLKGLGSFLQFLSWPDFLLGLSAEGNGTNFSNVFASYDDSGLTAREFRVWEASGFVQDDYKLTNSFTLNISARYERLGHFADQLGRNASFDVSKADPNPPASGSQAGYIVASNFSGVLPPGVTRASNTFGNYGLGQNTIAPRIGFAWRFLPGTSRAVLRGGYGTYYSRPTGQAFYQNVLGAPFSEFRLNGGTANASATFQAPFAQPFPTPNSFPLFPAYSPTSSTTVHSISPNFRPAMIQQLSLNVQTEPSDGWVLQIGYVGTRGTRLSRIRSLNQAVSASPNNPIRGTTTNTLANLTSRVPIRGIPANSLVEMESEGSSWYNGLEVSLTKKLRRGLQLLASYTFSKTLDTDGADINSISAGTALTRGNQNSPRQRWGRASFDRTHRFVFSETWDLPSPRSGVVRAILGGWSLASVVTIQSGTALTITDSNATNVFGINQDRAERTGACSKKQLVKGGPIQSKLNAYLNTSCFTTPPIIGADGIGTGFGNSATGLVDGPPQANMDIALSKTVPLNWPVKESSLQFRAEFYNALNHPQFANPDANFSSPTFGVISSTAVNPRVGQLALKFLF